MIAPNQTATRVEHGYEVYDFDGKRIGFIHDGRPRILINQTISYTRTELAEALKRKAKQR